MPRIISQTAYRGFLKAIKQEETALREARRAALQASGELRSKRERLIWRYSDCKAGLAQLRRQLAECAPADHKYPNLSPAARARRR